MAWLLGLPPLNMLSASTALPLLVLDYNSFQSYNQSDKKKRKKDHHSFHYRLIIDFKRQAIAPPVWTLLHIAIDTASAVHRLPRFCYLTLSTNLWCHFHRRERERVNITGHGWIGKTIGHNQWKRSTKLILWSNPLWRKIH